MSKRLCIGTANKTTTRKTTKRTDYSRHIDEGVIQVRDRAGIGLPFSMGLMATSILATGVETDVAYRIAAGVG
jgi:hypothetical protein